MPLPEHPFTINGGCNCGSIRYRLNIPEFKDRPISPYCDEDARSDKSRIPTVLLDHCNDCRRATGCITPIWIACAMAFASFSIRRPGEERTWVPGSELLAIEDLASKKHLPLKVYNSSEARWRGFCEDCGTMICYRISGVTPDDWPVMVDILLGTIDREDLEKEWFVPEKELWWDMGIPWIQRLWRKGTKEEGLTRHPLWKMNHHVPEDA